MDLGGGAGAAGFFTGYFPSSEGATSTPEARACTTDIDDGDWLESVSAPKYIEERIDIKFRAPSWDNN